MANETILIIDDNLSIRNLLSTILEKSNFTVVTAENGEEGLFILKNLSPALVVLDLNMPRMSGLEFLERVQPMMDNPFSTIVLTGQDDAPSIRQCFELGVSSFLRKPVQLFEFRGLVEHFINTRRQNNFLKGATSNFKDVADSSVDGLLVLDLEGKLLYANPISEEILGVSTSELIGQEMGIPLENTGPVEIEIIRKGQKAGIGELHVVDIKWFNSNARLATVRDITNRKEYEQQIRRLAFHDPLTGLPNRALLTERLDYELLRAQRNQNMFAVMFMDLDRFKIVNDSLGHAAGDWLLKEAASRIQKCVRASDTLARQGGDEFIILLPDLKQLLYLAVLARRILDALEQPFYYETHEIYISGSIGINVYPQMFSDRNIENESESAMLLENADTAMYAVKNAGGNNFKFYKEGQTKATQDRLKLESQLHKALEQEELQLYYQPKIDINSGEVVGLEALIRWNHPERGMVSPLDFIPIAEENGLIVPIGDWILKCASSQNQAFLNSSARPIRMGVNISPRQFHLEDLGDRILNILHSTGMNAENLEIEITESLLMHQPERAQKIMQELHQSGMRISIDDFGTGYSSLSRLKHFPVDILKIDSSFITGLPTDHDNMNITSAIIALAHNLNLEVIAEGVETVEQLECLKAMGCDQIQGYLYSRPLPAHEIVKFMQRVPVIPGV